MQGMIWFRARWVKQTMVCFKQWLNRLEVSQVVDRVITQPKLDSASNDSQTQTLRLRIERDLCYDTAQEVVSSMRCLIAQSPEEIVIEIGKLNSVDSSGLMALIDGRNLCVEAGVEFRLDKISDGVAHIVELNGLSHLLGLPERELLDSVHRPEVHLEDAVWKTCEHVVTSDPSLIAALREKITNAAEEAGASGEVLCDIKIAVGEAVTNAYRHGSPEKGASRIQVRCMTCSSAVVVEVEDEGAPFDFNATPEPDHRTLKDHGMGLHLMRQAMDEVSFSNNCPGNRVLMVKWLKDD